MNRYAFRETFRETGPDARFDLTGEGNVDGADLSLMAANWLWQRLVAAGVPEPVSAIMLLLGLPALLWHRRGPAG